MRWTWGIAFAAGTILAVPAFQTAPQTTPNDELSRRFIRTATGTVKSYAKNSQIVIVAEDGAEIALPLDPGTRVEDSLAEGQMVTVAWLEDSVGRQRVTSIAPYTAGSETAEGGSASSAPPSKAYASTQDGAAMSTTPAGPAASTPRPSVTGGAEYMMTPGRGVPTPTPGSPLGSTPARPARTPASRSGSR
jgi:hypothetical protein